MCVKQNLITIGLVVVATMLWGTGICLGNNLPKQQELKAESKELQSDRRDLTPNRIQDEKLFFGSNEPRSREWRLIGPGIVGCMGDVVFDPKDAKTMYCGTDMGAVFKTTNGGLNWRILGGASPGNRGVATEIIERNSIAVAWNNPDIVWFANNRVYKSIDGGNTLKEVTLPLPAGKWANKKIYLDPSDDNIVYIHNELIHQRTSRKTDGSLIRTRDSGKTWETVVQWPEAEKRFWASFVIDRYSKIVPGEGYQGLFLCGYGYLLRSEDGGKTWKDIKGNLPYCLIRDLLAIPIDGKKIALIASCLEENPNGRFNGNIYRSDDNGKSWVEKNNGIDLIKDVVYLDFNIANSPSVPSVIYYGPGKQCRLYRSTDLGESWKIVCDKTGLYYVAEIQPKTPEGKIIDWFFLKQDGKYFLDNGGYALPITNGGNCLDHAYAANWTSQRSIAVSPSDPNVIAFTHATVIATTDGGKNWRDICSDLGESFAPQRWPSGKFPTGKSYLVRNDLNFKPVTDPNAVFFPAPSDNTHLMKSRGVQVIVPKSAAFDPYNPYATIAVGYMDIGLRISRDGGTWWEWAYDRSCMLKNDTVVGSPVIYDPNVKGRMYIGTGFKTMGDIFRSDDSGRTFQRLNLAPLWTQAQKAQQAGATQTAGVITRIIIDPSSPAGKRTLYVGVKYGHLNRGEKTAAIPIGGIYKTNDAGMTWTSASDGLGLDADIYELVINEKNPDILYAGAYGNQLKSGTRGLFKTIDGGKNWRRLQPDKIGGILDYGIALCAAKPDTLWVVAYPAGIEEYFQKKLFRSDDGGDTWSEIAVKLDNKNVVVNSVAVNPVDPDWLYVVKSRNFNDEYDRGVVLRSKNGGKSWDVIDDGKIPETHFGSPVGPFIQIDKCDPRRLILYATYGLWIGYDPEAPCMN
jgi:photosystem II stability/assembly factor-like uncharacterized protein